VPARRARHPRDMVPIDPGSRALGKRPRARWIRGARRGLAAVGAASAVVALAGAETGAAAPSAPAPECPSALLAAASGSRAAPDAAVAEDLRIPAEALAAVEPLLPPEVREHADALLAAEDGLAVAACHRPYPVAAAYREATRRHAGRASLDAAGNLRGYVAGLPFPPEAIDPEDPRAGLRWAWNLALRYRGAGPSGAFRIVDVGGRGRDQRSYRGSFFFLRTAHRADLGASDHAVPGVGPWLFAAGGHFESPYSARHLAWRQLRPRASLADAFASDDIFVYVPTMRRPERSATAWVDGLFVPRYTVSGHPSGGSSAGGGLRHHSFQRGGAVTEHIRRGMTGLALRPNAYTWRWTDTREVLAPLNDRRLCAAGGAAADFGTGGLSLGGATWEVRRAVVLEARARRGMATPPRLTLYVDRETQQPLFHIARNASGAPLETGILVHRYSGDQESYPPGPGGAEARVFDPVAAAFLDAGGGRGGWRRVSCDVASVPPDPRALRRLTSVSTLTRGR